MSISPNKENKEISDVEVLEREARKLYEEGDLQGSLKSLKRAYQINPTSRLERRIDRLNSVIDSNKNSDIDRLIEKTTNLSIREDVARPVDTSVI